MSLKVGLSILEDSYKAALQAVEQAVGSADAPAARLTLVFATDHYDPGRLLKAVNDRVGSDNVIGSTVAGVFDGQGMTNRGVVVGLLQGSELDVHCSFVEDLSDDQQAVGQKLGETFSSCLASSDQNALQILLPDGLTNTVSSMLDALFHRLGSRALYAGGASGDNFCFLKTSQFFGSTVLKDALVAGLLLSEKPFGVSAAHGWRPVSSPMIVTRAEGNVIHELDWRPAYDVYSEFARDVAGVDIEDVGFAQFAMGHPFGIPQAQDDSNYIVRDPVSRGADDSLSCVGEVPVNSVLRILNGDRESLLQAVKKATSEAMAQLGSWEPAGVLVFSCASRCVFLEDDFQQEVAVIRDVTGQDVPICGCLTYGEIGALGAGPPEFHNKSVVICTLPK